MLPTQHYRVPQVTLHTQHFQAQRQTQHQDKSLHQTQDLWRRQDMFQRSQYQEHICLETEQE